MVFSKNLKTTCVTPTVTACWDQEIKQHNNKQYDNWAREIGGCVSRRSVLFHLNHPLSSGSPLDGLIHYDQLLKRPFPPSKTASNVKAREKGGCVARRRPVLFRLNYPPGLPLMVWSAKISSSSGYSPLSKTASNVKASKRERRLSREKKPVSMSPAARPLCSAAH